MTSTPAALSGIKACVFDAYGTLFDFASAAKRCRDVLGDDVDRLTALWRDKQLQYTWLRAAQGRHADFWQVTGDALDFALETLNIDKPALRDRLMTLYLTLDPFPEVAGVLQALKADGLKIAILSNGSPRMLDAVVQEAKLCSADRHCPVGGRGRRLQAASKGLSARGRSPRRAGRSDSVPVVQRLGRPCGICVRHAGRLVQPLCAAPGTAARLPDREIRSLLELPALVGAAPR